jgi:hypothetical protein
MRKTEGTGFPSEAVDQIVGKLFHGRSLRQAPLLAPALQDVREVLDTKHGLIHLLEEILYFGTSNLKS